MKKLSLIWLTSSRGVKKKASQVIGVLYSLYVDPWHFVVDMGNIEIVRILLDATSVSRFQH